MADESTDRDGNTADPVVLGGGDAPCDGGHVRRNAPVHIPLEVRDDLRPPLLPPHLRARHAATVAQDERIG